MGIPVVKSLVFKADGASVLIIMLLADKVDVKKVASVLNLRRSRVRMALPQEVAETGFEIGRVPPVGHRTPLLTLIDRQVTLHGRILSGSGSSDQLLQLSTPDLLQSSKGCVADLAVSAAPKEEPLATNSSASSPGMAEQLPEPWAQGAQTACLKGRIAGRRRLGNCLVFADLVPLDTPLHPQEFASPIRQQWRHPESEQPCRVQLVLGATLESQLGSKALTSLLDEVRVGEAVEVVGRPSARQSDEATAGRSADDLDLICHNLRLLPAGVMQQDTISQVVSTPRDAKFQHRNRSRTRAPAPDLSLPLYSLPPEQIILVDSLAKLESMRDAIMGSADMRTAAHPGISSSSDATAQAVASRSQTATAREDTSQGRENSLSAAATRAVCQDKAGASHAAAGGFPDRSEGPEAEPSGAFASGAAVAGDEGGPAAVRQGAPSTRGRGLLGPVAGSDAVTLPRSGSEDCAAGGREGEPSSRSRERGMWPVVGLDAEWEPSDPNAPVSLLQISTRDTAFLVDMLWFCSPAVALSGGSDRPQSQEVTPREQALSDFLAELLRAEGILKLGFGLEGDLRRLCQSYPHLPCFGGSYGEAAGVGSRSKNQAVQLRGYVDTRQLALAVAPPQEGLGRYMGLATLAALTLAQRLDKSQQVSAWGSRPLLPKQLAYAGADAHVLTAIFDKLVSGWLQAEGRDSGLPRGTVRSLDIAEVAAEARARGLLLQTLPPAQMPNSDQPGLPALRGRKRYERTPRLETKAGDHGINMAALERFLGVALPKEGRSVVMQYASADAEGNIPVAVPRYPRGGGVVNWKNATMLFVSVDSFGASMPYSNTFPQDGRRMVWFPSPGHSERHPVIRRMLRLDPETAAPAAMEDGGSLTTSPENEHHVLLFCRMRSRSWTPFAYFGQLGNPVVDWSAGSNGVFVWELLDFDRLCEKLAFQAAIAAANERKMDHLEILQQFELNRA